MHGAWASRFSAIYRKSWLPSACPARLREWSWAEFLILLRNFRRLPSRSRSVWDLGGLGPTQGSFAHDARLIESTPIPLTRALTSRPAESDFA